MTDTDADLLRVLIDWSRDVCLDHPEINPPPTTVWDLRRIAARLEAMDTPRHLTVEEQGVMHRALRRSAKIHPPAKED